MAAAPTYHQTIASNLRWHTLQPFDTPLPTSQNQLNPDKPVLDPTAIRYSPGYVKITTEVEWMQLFGMSTSPYWVKGEWLWADEWLRLG